MNCASRPWKRLFIANRGEIALRIIRTARELGLETVAMVAADDADALHARVADHVVSLPLGKGYLDIEAVVAAARASGAQALHPGYGFLAENPDFAQACADAGIVFVGPSPETIRTMGDKASARRAMARAGLAVIPGYDGSIQNDAHLAAQAQRLGYPLMIKACAGGGGRGMRRVESTEGFAQALEAARAEAKAAFDDDSVLLERAIDGARHIEFQILADQYGRVLHLGERDCSVQRRHQKLIEEAPAPGVNASFRERIGRELVTAIGTIGYLGAGTVEMLLAPTGECYFMEMNTRLQVEHPVTEEVFGVDLVRWQLMLAAGEALPEQLGKPGPQGHAIEVRLCSENPEQGFLPHSGVIGRWRPPEGVRVEHALADGVGVSVRYDSMIAKVIAHGRDREEARQRLLRALGDLSVLGVSTNRDFLMRCLAHPDFISANFHTGFITQHSESLINCSDDEEQQLLAVAACLCAPQIEGLPLFQPLGHRFPVSLRLRLNNRVHELVVQRAGSDRFSVISAGAHTVLALTEEGGGAIKVQTRAMTNSVQTWRDGANLWLASRSLTLRFENMSLAAPTSRLGSASGWTTDSLASGGLVAPTSARVAVVKVSAGDRVARGDWLLSLEAMKIEHRITAVAGARVKAVHVSPGSLVRPGQVLVEFEEIEETSN